MFGIVAEPSLSGKMKKQHSGGQIIIANPGFKMEDIEEEGSSVGSSLPGTPQLGSTVAPPTATVAEGERPLLPNALPKSSLQNASPAVRKNTQRKDASPQKLMQNHLNALPAAQENHQQMETSSPQEKLVQNASPVAMESSQQNSLQECPLAAAREKEKSQQLETASAPPASEKKPKQQASSSVAHRVERKAALAVNQRHRKPRYNVQVLDLQNESMDDVKWI